MARRSQLDLRRLLTFGGQAPYSVGLLIAGMVVTTIAATAWPWLGALVVLSVPSLDPSSWADLLEVWRLVTWPFFQGDLPASLLTVLFAGFMLLWLGRQLSYAWTERRFLVRFFVITIGAGVGTLAVLAPFGYPAVYFGIWPAVNALLLTWGLIFPHQRLSWFGAVEMSGATVAKAVAVATPLWALVVAPRGAGLVDRLAAYLPHLLALGIAWLLVAGGPRRGLWRLREWWLRRRLASQRRRFKVIETGGAPKPPRWMN